MGERMNNYSEEETKPDKLDISFTEDDFMEVASTLPKAVVIPNDFIPSGAAISEKSTTTSLGPPEIPKAISVPEIPLSLMQLLSFNTRYPLKK